MRPALHHGGYCHDYRILQEGSIQYVNWCNRAGRRKGRPRGNKWVACLVAVRKSEGSDSDPGNEDWAPSDMMPKDYERGLTKSKGKMRAYVYGTPM